MRDVRGERLLARLQRSPGDRSRVPRSIRHAAVYLLEGDIPAATLERVASELLADPVTQVASIDGAGDAGATTVEIHPLPGVTDPAAESVEAAIRAMTSCDVRVRTAERYDLDGIGRAEAHAIAETHLANTVIHAIHDEPFRPERLPEGRPHELSIREIPLSPLDDAALERLSRETHLFLSLEEMRAVRDEYRRLGREPREIELETLAQTWSEHCVHKTLKSTVRYREASSPAGMVTMSSLVKPSGVKGRPAAARPGHEVQPDGSVIIRNLLRSTVAAATHELMEGRGRDGTPAPPIDWCLSVFVDNAGVIAFDEQHAICVKVETHNHPSAIEPYGGAATGIGGCIRDVMGTGLAAKPIAATDVFCVAPPNLRSVPQGCIAPARILEQVVAGVRDYGNRMGIPTLSGAVWFDDRHVGNPLVFCGTVGVLPRNRVRGAARAGDRIVAIGGRTGRDGIHGATFSSAELTDSHADEFGHAVQIGNAITEKKCLDALLAARDADDGPLFSAVTDCGAGGFSSAVGEMGAELGAEVHLERAPLKYDGLSPTEVWISEAQERMVLAVPAERLAALRRICELHEVELCELGHFGTPDRSLRLHWHGTEVGRLDMHFLHEGIPMPTRDALWDPEWGVANGGVRCDDGKPADAAAAANGKSGADAKRSTGTAGALRPRDADRDAARRAERVAEDLLALIGHPNIASREWIIRQYDHEVQGASVLKPLVGARAEGPGDASVILPVAGSRRGVAIAAGLATGLAADPYLMGLAAIDECVRNLVCVGADPDRIAILDNFCWPSCKDERNLGSLVRAAEACYDGAHAYRTPFISGKDSLNNQFVTNDGRVIQIPPTLLISGIGIVHDTDRCVTMDLKRAGNVLLLVGSTSGRLGGSHWASMHQGHEGHGSLADLPRVDLEQGPRLARLVAKAIELGLVRSAHDLSEGGLLVAAAEMAIAGGLGCSLDLACVPFDGAVAHGAGSAPASPGDRPLEGVAFAEDPSRYLLEVEPSNLDAITALAGTLPLAAIGRVESRPELVMETGVDAWRTVVPLESLRTRWLRGAELP